MINICCSILKFFLVNFNIFFGPSSSAVNLELGQCFHITNCTGATRKIIRRAEIV